MFSRAFISAHRHISHPSLPIMLNTSPPSHSLLPRTAPTTSNPLPASDSPNSASAFAPTACLTTAQISSALGFGMLRRRIEKFGLARFEAHKDTVSCCDPFWLIFGLLERPSRPFLIAHFSSPHTHTHARARARPVPPRHPMVDLSTFPGARHPNRTRKPRPHPSHHASLASRSPDSLPGRRTHRSDPTITHLAFHSSTGGCATGGRDPD